MKAGILAVATAGSLLVAHLSASAGVIRHDRAEQDHFDLATLYPSVGQFKGSTPDYDFFASGTLITSNWVLTAAHVVDDASSLEFTLGSTKLAATNWYAHPDWDGDLGKGYDIGLVELSNDFPDVAPAKRYAGTDEVGKVGTSAGFGMTGTGETGAVTFDGKKRAGNNVVDALLRTPGKDNRILLSDFDNPLDPADSSWGSSSPLDLEYLIAPGDSGGGLFVEVDGIDWLAGVHSFGWGRLDGDPNSDYGDASGHTRVSSFNAWIDSVLNPGGSGSDDGSDDGKTNNGKGGGRPFTLSALQVQDVSEPGSFILLAGALGLLAVGLRRRTA